MSEKKNKPIDIFVTAYLRQFFTEQTIKYLEERTDYPYRLFMINNGGNNEVCEEADRQKKLFLEIRPNYNLGIHAAWNIALAMAESDYFITTDNDIYVPDLRHWAEMSVDNETYLQPTKEKQPCWLERLIRFMDERPDYGAISLHPHIFIGAAGIDPKDKEDVKERNMCGAVMRIMRREAVWKVGGWEKVIRTGRNHEEKTICSRLQTAGYKVGICSRLRAYHPFGKGIGGNWGYPKEFTPEMQGHNPAIKDYVVSFDNEDAYDKNTWMPK